MQDIGLNLPTGIGADNMMGLVVCTSTVINSVILTFTKSLVGIDEGIKIPINDIGLFDSVTEGYSAVHQRLYEEFKEPLRKR